MLWLVILLCCIAVMILIAVRLGLQYRRLRRDFPNPAVRRNTNHPNLEAWPKAGISVTWIGHSTVYMNVEGLRLLTDPVFSSRVGVRIWPFLIGPKRYTPPTLTIEGLKDKVDVILLSHAHLDHVDLPTLRRFAHRRIQVITAIGTGRLLRSMPFGRIFELGGNDVITLEDGTTVEAVPVRHWGRRYPWNKHYRWTGYVISHAGKRVFFAGDTAYTQQFRSQFADQPPPDVAVLPIGAYAPDSFQGSHCTPEEAWRMFVDTGAAWMVPVHWNTFVLSQEPIEEPMIRLLEAAAEQAYRIAIRNQGEAFHLALGEKAMPIHHTSANGGPT